MPRPQVLPGLIFVGLLACLLSGCVADKQNGLTVPTHGNFCGPNHPAISATSDLQELITLLEMEAVDDFDAACKRHDICYLLTGYFSVPCDEWFMFELSKETHWEAETQQQAQFCEQQKKDIMSGGRLVAGGIVAPRIHHSDGTTTEFELPSILSYVNNLPFRIGGAILAAPTMVVQHQEYLDNQRYLCNQRQTHQWSAPWYAYMFEDNLTEILIYKKYITPGQALAIRRRIIKQNREPAVRDIDAAWPYSDLHQDSISQAMNKFQNPVLKGRWTIK